MQIFPLWSPKILPLNLDVFLKAFDILTSWLFFILVSSLCNIVVIFIERKLILISFTEVLKINIALEHKANTSSSTESTYVPEIKLFCDTQKKMLTVFKLTILLQEG